MTEKNEISAPKRKRGGKQPGAGKPPLKPTDKDRAAVEKLAGFGLTQENIAALTMGGIDCDTLRKHFKQELQAGKAKANAKVGQSLFQMATGGDTTAAIWWSKTQMGWKEAKDVEPENEAPPLSISFHVAPAAGPVKITNA